MKEKKVLGPIFPSAHSSIAISGTWKNSGAHTKPNRRLSALKCSEFTLKSKRLFKPLKTKEWLLWANKRYDSLVWRTKWLTWRIRTFNWKKTSRDTKKCMKSYRQKKKKSKNKKEAMLGGVDRMMIEKTKEK